MEIISTEIISLIIREGGTIVYLDRMMISSVKSSCYSLTTKALCIISEQMTYFVINIIIIIISVLAEQTHYCSS